VESLKLWGTSQLLKRTTVELRTAICLSPSKLRGNCGNEDEDVEEEQEEEECACFSIFLQF
jgi:hypothetical protein